MTPRHFASQAWHKLTSTVVLRGRRGTNSHLPSFCVAGVLQMALGGALGLGLGVRGRRGTKSHLPSFCVGLAWQAWHRWQQKLTSTLFLRGSDMFTGLFTYVMFRHVLWSLWHVLFSDMLPASLRLFCWLVYACPAPALFLVAPACCFYCHVFAISITDMFSACLSAGMPLLSHASACLISWHV